MVLDNNIKRVYYHIIKYNATTYIITTKEVKNMSIYEIATILKKFNTDYIIKNFEIYGYIPVFNAINWNYPVKKINLTNVSKNELLTILNTGFIKG